MHFPSHIQSVERDHLDVTRTKSDSHPTHYHHLRKSFCSYGLFRLLLPGGCEPPDYMSKADRSWLMAGLNFRPEEVRRTDQPGIRMSSC